MHWKRCRHLLTVVFLLSSMLVLEAQTRPLAVIEADVRVSFAADRFQVELPVSGANSAAMAIVLVDLVDTQDAVRSHGAAQCTLRSNPTVCKVELPPASLRSGLKTDDGVPLLRLRYRVEAPPALATGTLALDHIAPTLYVLHAEIPEHVRPGTTYSVRICATHPLTLAPQGNVPLQATATASFANTEQDAVIVHRRLTTNHDGFATFEFTTPHNARLDSVTVSVEGHLANLRNFIDETINSVHQNSLALTTDKPLYQPGQTVHLRVLAQDRSGHAQPKASLTFDVRDPDSTLVFRTEATTSLFGIASADWQVPARLRLGTYELAVTHSKEADADATETNNENSSRGASAHGQVRISRYDLPTFTVTSKPDKPFYLPGENAAVNVGALYLFGKPVVHGHVRVVRESERTWNFEKQKNDIVEGAVYQGEIGKDGIFTAHVDLAADEKDYRADDPLTGPNAFEDLHLAAYVTDASTGRTEQRRFDLRVTHRPLHVRILHDATNAKALALGFTVSVETADGLPAADADVRLALLPGPSFDPKETDTQRSAHALPIARMHTNAYGLARVEGLPTYEELLQRMPPPVLPLQPNPNADDSAPQLELLATAHVADGRAGAVTQTLEAPSALLRLTTDRSLYKPGDPILIKLASALPSVAVNVQLLRITQSGPLTLATDNVTLHNGRATFTVSSSLLDKPDFRYSGYITVVAVALAAAPPRRNTYGGYNEDDVTASRTILFPRDNALHVDVKLAHTTYRPGETASATIKVTGPQDADGDETSPARLALGLVAVDQAVNERNRSDNEFGSGSSFFFPWRSGYQSNDSVAGFTLADLEKRDPETPFSAALDLAASVLLGNSGEAVKLFDNTSTDDLANVYGTALARQVNGPRNSLATYLKTHTELPTSAAELDAILSPDGLSVSALRDPWDRPFRLKTSVDYNQITLQLTSDGPDKLPGTPDDFTVKLAAWNWFAHHEADLRRVIASYHQRTRSFIRDLPTLTAALQAEGIDRTAWRDPWGQPLQYTFAIDRTAYTIVVSTPGPPPAAGHVRRAPFQAGGAALSWFGEQRLLMQNALSSYAEAHLFPTTEADFRRALDRFGVPGSALLDPWGHPLFPTFHTRFTYTDRVSMEAHAQTGQPAQKRTTVTPVTATVDTIDLNSLGPDGIRGKASSEGYPDDFIVASFAHVRAEQSAKQAVPQAAPAKAINSGEPTIATGTLAGTVTDPSGAVVPNARILATNDATRAEFEAHSDNGGGYVLDLLPEGLYTVRFESQGFMTTVIDQAHVLSPDATLLDVTLQVGAVSETVEVTSSSVSLQTESTSVSGAMDLVGGLPGGVAGGRFRRPMVPPGPPPPPPPDARGTPRVREYFPETLLWRPEVLTTPDGEASIHFPVADTLTSWQLSVAASTLHGNTGAGAAGFSTFLPFFAAFDPPQVLTVNDHLTLPIPLRNYLDHPVSVASTLAPVAWLGIDTLPATTVIPAQDSASPVSRLTALAPVTGGRLLFTARPDGEAGDSIERSITVHPDGLETAVTTAGLVNGPTTFHLTIPADALPGGTDLMLKVYPNLPAHLRDALVAMAVYPDGCAEQITSIAWPSLLLQRYAATLPTPDQALQAQTRLRLEAAYANLLGDRDSNGGFRYWSNSPRADLALTAYVVQFLTAAGRFIAVDENVIQSAVAYLGRQQSAGGLWIGLGYDGKPRTSDNDGNAMLTASIAAMLAGAPGADPLIAKALTAVQPFTESDEPYTLANYVLAAVAVHDTARSTPAVTRLRSLALSENGGAYWSLETNTPFFGWGRAGRVEATAAALRALLASGATPQDDLVTRGLLFLDHQQDRQSLWYSTQATARVLDVMAAIALSGEPAAARQAKPGNLIVHVDDTAAATVALPPPGKDTGPLFLSLGTALTPGAHTITLEVPPGTPTATAQIVAHLYTPWSSAPPASAIANNEQLRLAIRFDSTAGDPAKPIHAIAHIERLGFRGYGMLIAELGLPPGSEVDRASLEAAIADSGYVLNHYEVLPDKLLIYLWPAAGGYDLHFTFTLRYAIDALTAPSAVYDYYNPDARLEVPPQRFTSEALDAKPTRP